MQIGSPFQWAVGSGGYRANGRIGLTKQDSKYRPAHLDGQCFARIEVIEEAERFNEIESRFRS
jgi:hypothetical protein